MSINGIIKNIKPVESLIPSVKQVEKGEVSSQAPKFADALGNALKEVSDLQLSADKQIENLVLGEGDVSPHGAMIALEKADIAFQMMNSIRSKIIRAYEEILRTQV